MHATIDVRFELRIDTDKTVPLAAIAEYVRERELEAQLITAFVDEIDRQLVLEYCGEKHARGNGSKRFQRAGSKEKGVVTTAGEHDLNLRRVKDTEATDDQNDYFRPVEEVISFDGKKRYLQDISAKMVDLATNLSYRNAADAGDQTRPTPSRSTIHGRVAEYGSRLRSYVGDHLESDSSEADAVIADGTVCHSQDDGVKFNDIHVSLGQDSDGTASLLDVGVDEPWEEAATNIDEAVAADAPGVRDAEEELVEELTTDDRVHQLDLPHVTRTVGYNLWKDGELPLGERKQFTWEITEDLLELKNAVTVHAPAGEFDAIQAQLDRTKERIKKTAWHLEQLSCPLTASYLRRWLPAMTTFAEDALRGRETPWTSNRVERAMGEVAKRCKNQGMRWSRTGLEALLQLRLLKYIDAETYAQFLDELLDRSTKTAMSSGLSVVATRGLL